MSDADKRNNRKKTNVWLVIGAVVLIILLLFWLTFAFFLGDTDVAAFITI